jgi:hypothetical protein
MKKWKLKHGRHPTMMKNLKQLNQIAKAVYKIDPYARIIPGRFNKHRKSIRPIEVKINPINSKEVFLKVTELLYISRFKIECSSKREASLVYSIFREGSI